MPVPILALSYWLHLVATVLWIGGLAVLVIGGAGANLPDALEQRLHPLANVSLVVLLITGIVQMDESPYYEGFLRFSNSWSAALLLKHIVFGMMAIVSAALQWGVQPALARAKLLARCESDPSIEDHLSRRAKTLTALNLGLGILVLLLTAIMTAL